MNNLKKEIILLKSSMILGELVKSSEVYQYNKIIDYLNNNTNFKIGFFMYDKDIDNLNKFIDDDTIYSRHDLINCFIDKDDYYYIYDSVNNKVTISGFSYDDSCFSSNIREFILNYLNDDEINNYYEFLDKNYYFN